jgi:hypothetical protein
MTRERLAYLLVVLTIVWMLYIGPRKAESRSLSDVLSAE